MTDDARPRLRAITFDFWSTLVDGAVTPERTAKRLAWLHEAIVGGGHRCTREELEDAYRRAGGRLGATARETLQDVGPPGRWAVLAEELGIPRGKIPYEVVERAYEEVTLEPLPEAMPHVRGALDELRNGGYKLAVICNTGMAGGRVLREVLARHGLLEAFETTVFSNEFGWSKPHPAIFRHTLEQLGGIQPDEALHVGDLEELDVEGARRSGLYAALYAPRAVNGSVESGADLIVRNWREFAGQVTHFQASGARPRAAEGRSRAPVPSPTLD